MSKTVYTVSDAVVAGFIGLRERRRHKLLKTPKK
jgi:hypothetical protein